MNPKGTPTTMRDALQSRGVNLDAIVEGNGALDWLVDDMGQELRETPCPGVTPKRVIGFARVGKLNSRNRPGHYRMNSGLCLTPCLTRILWG